MDWKAEYLVGLKEIDEQHKELLSLFARIVEAISSEISWSETHYRIVELRTFAEFHFEFEEALMRMFGYAEQANHTQKHKLFFVKLAECEKSSILKEVEAEMIKLLFDWLFGHILVEDKAYAGYILSGAQIIRS